VDAGGYRHQRTVALRSKAVAISRIVIETGREMSLEPLTPEELAEVQDELKAIPQVRYRVVGDGPRRDVVIAPSRT
jgi:predicted RNA-binding protein Jag